MTNTNAADFMYRVGYEIKAAQSDLLKIFEQAGSTNSGAIAEVLAMLEPTLSRLHNRMVIECGSRRRRLAK